LERGTVSLARRDDVLLKVIPHFGPDLRSARAIEAVGLWVGDMGTKWLKVVEHLIEARWDIGLAYDNWEYLAHDLRFGHSFFILQLKRLESPVRELRR
jgi:hypothetical protein